MMNEFKIKETEELYNNLIMKQIESLISEFKDENLTEKIINYRIEEIRRLEVERMKEEIKELY